MIRPQYGAISVALAIACSSCAAPTPPPKIAAREPAPPPRAFASSIDELGPGGDPPYFVLAPPTASPLSGRPRLMRPVTFRTGLAELGSLSKSDTKDLAGGRFDLVVKEGGYRLVSKSDLLSEVEVDGFFRAYTWSKLGAPASLALARRGDGAELKNPTKPAVAVERGIRMGAFGEDALTWVEYDATYEPSKSRGEASARREASAKALWPGVVYAFVADDELSGERRLVVVSPPAAWVTSEPQSARDQLRPHVGSFTFVAVPLDGPTATVSLSFTDGELDTFLALRRGKGVARDRRSREPEPPDASPSVRVLVEVENDGDGPSMVRTRVEPLSPSAILDTALAVIAAREARDASPPSADRSGALGVKPGRPRSRPEQGFARRGCTCEPNDPICPCFD